MGSCTLRGVVVLGSPFEWIRSGSLWSQLASHSLRQKWGPDPVEPGSLAANVPRRSRSGGLYRASTPSAQSFITRKRTRLLLDPA